MVDTASPSQRPPLALHLAMQDSLSAIRNARDFASRNARDFASIFEDDEPEAWITDPEPFTSNLAHRPDPLSMTVFSSPPSHPTVTSYSSHPDNSSNMDPYYFRDDILVLDRSAPLDDFELPSSMRGTTSRRHSESVGTTRSAMPSTTAGQGI